MVHLRELVSVSEKSKDLGIRRNLISFLTPVSGLQSSVYHLSHRAIDRLMRRCTGQLLHVPHTQWTLKNDSHYDFRF